MGKNRNEIESGHQRTDALQQEIRQTESQLSDTLHTIEERLSPSNLKQQLKQGALQWGAKGAVRISYAFKNKKAPSIIGAGLLFLLATRAMRKRKAVRVNTELLREQITESLVEQSVKSAKFRVVMRGIAVALGTALGTAASRMVRSREPVYEPEVTVTPGYGRVAG